MVKAPHILLTIIACLQTGLSAGQRPNILFLLADDMNRDSWGVYGNQDCKTPNIDRLAREGMTFNRAYCSVAMCAPFRQELYSGRSPWRTRTLANHSKSKPGTRSIAHYLKPPAAITAFKPGKWNTMSIRAVGRHVIVHLNGTKTAELTDDPGRLKGHFGLQLHGGQKMDVAFRNIRIKELR